MGRGGAGWWGAHQRGFVAAGRLLASFVTQAQTTEELRGALLVEDAGGVRHAQYAAHLTQQRPVVEV